MFLCESVCVCVCVLLICSNILFIFGFAFTPKIERLFGQVRVYKCKKNVTCSYSIHWKQNKYFNVVLYNGIAECNYFKGE